MLKKGKGLVNFLYEWYIEGMSAAILRDKQSFALRTNIWLLSKLDYLWSNFFTEMEQTNPIFIKFGRYSKYRLGSIRLDRRTEKSYITITSMFKNPKIPVEVVEHTIAHELVHYAHGFSSKRTRLHKYPHAGGVVQREMDERGLGHLNKAYKIWVKSYREQLASQSGRSGLAHDR